MDIQYYPYGDHSEEYGDHCLAQVWCCGLFTERGRQSLRTTEAQEYFRAPGTIGSFICGGSVAVQLLRSIRTTPEDHSRSNHAKKGLL